MQLDHAAPAQETSWPLVAFDAAEILSLIELGLLEPPTCGPMADLLAGAAPPSLFLARRAAGSLHAKGLLSGGIAAESPFWPALKVLARPEAALRIAQRDPGAGVSIIPLYLAGALAAPAYLAEDGLHLGAAMPKAQLSESIHGQLARSEGEEGAVPLALPPIALRAVSLLFPAGERGLAETIPYLEAFRALDAMVSDSALVEPLLELLLDFEVLEADLYQFDVGYRLSARARPWLESVLSGYSCELELTPLGEAREPGSRRLLFLGPPGKRVLLSELEPSDALAELESSSTEPWLCLAELPVWALDVQLRLRLGLDL